MMRQHQDEDKDQGEMPKDNKDVDVGSSSSSSSSSSSLVSVSSGGEPLSADLIDWAKTSLGAEVNELYGQTECNLSAGSARTWGVSKPGWIGQEFPGFDLRILDTSTDTDGGDRGREVKAGEVGQICVHKQTPSMFLRYWNQPEKTSERFIETCDGEYLITGDLGVKDEKGYLRFVARDDDIICSSGYRIGPTEIEAVLAQDPRVVMAAVVAAPDPSLLRGHVIGAYVTLVSNSNNRFDNSNRPPNQSPEKPETTEMGFEQREQREQFKQFEQELIAKVAKKLSPHMAPKWVRFIEEMPMTATGKIRRVALREMAAQEQQSKIQQLNKSEAGASGSQAVILV